MNKSTSIVAMVAIAFVIAIGSMTGRAVNAAPTTVGLGGADSYAVFAAATITNNSGPTTINGDLGLDPGTSVTGTSTMTVNGAQNVANAASLSARNLLKAAYADAAGRTPFITVTGGVLGGTYVAGVYRGGALDLSTTSATVTLDGENDPSAVFIFQAASTLVTAGSTTVNLVRGAQSCNVFWQVGSSATLGASSTFRGTILAHTSISVGTSANVDGRLLAGVGASTDSPSSDTGALTLLTNTVTKPTCAAAAAPSTSPPCAWMANIPNAPCTGTRPAAATPASATATPSTPSATPTAASVAMATPTIAPSAPTVAPPTVTPRPAAVAGAQSLPSTSTGDPANPLTILGVALTGFGILLLRRPTRHL